MKWAALLFMMLAAQAAHSEELTVAAAADLTYCLPAINEAFEKANPGSTVKVSFGSSGNFFAQIQGGAPFDVFLSADIQYPKKLATLGLTSEPQVYAQGRIVLWTMKDGLDVTHGLSILSDPSIKHVALANPDHAPYGRAAKAALQHEKLWDALTPKFVYGENIAQTAQFVQTGNADAGFVALSLVLGQPAGKAGRYFEVSGDDYPAIDQAVAITKGGQQKPLAQTYVTFLKSDDARKILERFGFQLPK